MFGEGEEGIVRGGNKDDDGRKKAVVSAAGDVGRAYWVCRWG